ncbi:hypothetical protein M0R72_05835 [Candidatus Pacearchaeota archaeon]|nr:hypothetical protein [Candidatus Pacearchaeota archaeon]
MIDLKLLETEAEVTLRYTRMIESLERRRDRDIENLKIDEWRHALDLLDEMLKNHPNIEAGHGFIVADYDAMNKIFYDIGKLPLWKLGEFHIDMPERFDSIRYINMFRQMLGCLESERVDIELRCDDRTTELRLSRARDLLLIECTKRLQNF